MTKVLIVRADGSTEAKSIEPTLEQFQSIVGGYIEGIVGNGWVAYCNEEGKIKGLPVNALATVLAYDHGWEVNDVLVGDVVFLGKPDPHDEDAMETDVPSALTDAAAAALE